MNLERDLEYSERSTRSKRLLIAISIILAGLLIVSLISILKFKGERDTLSQQITMIRKEKEAIQLKNEELGKENEALRRQVASIIQERDRLSKELLLDKAPLPKKAKKKVKR